MTRVPQQPDERDRLEAGLRAVHRRARRFDDELKDLAAYCYENPSKNAQALLFLVPRQMDAWQQEALSRFGYDLENREKREDFAIETYQDAVELVRLMNHYYTYDGAMERWTTLVDNGLSGEQLAIKVCEAFVEAYRERPGLAAYGLELIEAGLPDRLKGLLLSTYLASYLATHTSLHVNRPLRHGIDERRNEDETRFARLLKELSAEGLDAYRQRPRSSGDLMDIRTEVARKLEKRAASPRKAELVELAKFASREELLTLAKRAKLSKQESDVFELWVSYPNISLREMATRLGMRSTNQVGVVRHRVKRKFMAAAF
jgi:hypothetical protein